MSPTPLVSCIMPTRNRRRFVSQAIWYFMRQDYTPRELIILDDGQESVADLVPNDERVHYKRLERRMPLGAKRNLACELARGDLIAHWDDDDWMSPQRLSLQVAELLDSGVEVCGARDLLHYRLEAGEAWLYRYPSEARPWLAGCTLLYRRAAWAAHPFPEADIGEDNAFVWQFPPQALHAVADSSFYLALIHPGNTAPKNLADPRWQRRAFEEVSRLLEPDRDFYVQLRNGRPAPGAYSARERATVTVGAPFMVYDGYGSMAEYLVLGMARAGAQVNIVPLGLDLSGMTPEFQAIARRSQPDNRAPVLYFCWPREDLRLFQAANDLFINTMWESSRLPAAWPAQLNRARAVIVPTPFVAEVCRAGGVTVPVEVIREGIDPEVYHYEPRPQRAGLTTLIVGTVIDRKHTREGIAAWKLAFGEDPQARLIVKSRFSYGNYAPDDPRIRFVDSTETTRGIAHYYRQADVLLALGNEGFGLPLVEGMATGLPVIALDSEGQADTCAAAPGLMLAVEPARWEKYDQPPFGPAGVAGVPGVEQVAEKLRWVAEHREEARALGRAASEWAVKNRSVWGKGRAVLEVMERYSRPSRALRRLHTVWAPSWGTACGIAEFTAHLVEPLTGVRVTGTAPDWSGVRVLHIQHQDALLREAEVTRGIEQARQWRVPVAVTEHEVKAGRRVWEGEADALVALTTRGAEMLRARWPRKRVEYIPHGCPTWFPPRKAARGRVIGAFGFLEAHKGYYRLLDVLRTLPGTELLLFSHARYPEPAARWEEAIRGLPVRWVREFLPSEEIARRLAAEADVLVFWYDEVSTASASGAARIGLASGVPVLASPTGWFQELREVTFQPNDLVEGVRQLLEDSPRREGLSRAAREYCQANSWARTAERHLDLWRQLEGI